MKRHLNTHAMGPFLLLWLTQSFSTLGSSMTSFALVVWSYQNSGSALTTALLSVCSYAPYILMSVFAGALSDRWDKKRVMLFSDTFAACCTAAVLILLEGGGLRIWHLYLLNSLSGLMNTFQQPASEVAVSLLAMGMCFWVGQRWAVALPLVNGAALWLGFRMLFFGREE